MTPSIPWTTAEILEAVKGTLLSGDPQCVFAAIAIDSRKISKDDVFVAIPGEVHDGHNFIENVVQNGVHGLLINKDRIEGLDRGIYPQKKMVVIAVNDTVRALGDLAAFNRRRAKVSVVALTGSAGKTTTREMTASVLGRRFNILSTPGNFNNEIGLPLTLLRLSRRHEWAVLELGTNHPGEIKRLAEICMPDVGMIINIGPAHLKGLGSLEGVMDAKGELLEGLKSDATAVLNADDSRVLQLASKTNQKVLLYGLSAKAAVKAHSVKTKGMGVSFTLELPGEKISIDLKSPGLYMVSNALAAAAVGHLLGLSAREIKMGLENFKTVQGRMNILETAKGIHIIDDTYNANPASMAAAIDTLKALKGRQRGILVAGDMLELGTYAKRMHREIGKLSARSDIARLYATGEFAEALAEGARSEHMDPRSIFTGSKEEILENLKNRLSPPDWVLVKGSRSMRMETIVQSLKNWADGSE
ncbi:MAG: UDP-N-acetylmuramoyl-tripeptide--D-alanyl-D-alanine ligase [Desulfobacterales bacterium]|nr:UDP-N-acetylmuramoyl-tripeptide--D-alanyl-D-alanine ligase [Desulfobacterales bacterium]